MLDLYIELIVITFVSFLFLIFILNKLLYQPLLDFMDKRDMSIKNDIDNASKNQEEMQNSQKEAGNILKQARKEADELRQVATNKAIKKQEEELQKLRDELESKHIVFIEELDKDMKKYKKDMLLGISKLKVSLDNKLANIA